jgi:phosphoribosylamine---glycine ligase
VSLFCLTDGSTVVPLLPAQDFKRLRDRDEGPNTGGMGAYCPLPWLPPHIVDEVVKTVAQPTVDTMAARGTPFSGLLYVGLALTSDGPRVVEFNCRFGDPETQAVLALLDTPLGGLLHAVATGRLADVGPLRWRDGAAVVVVLASEGYPDSPVTGDAIDGVHEAAAQPGVQVLHAGTALVEGRLVTAGGRVLGVTAVAADLAKARVAAYSGVDRVRFRGAHHRTDIAAAATS